MAHTMDPVAETGAEESAEIAALKERLSDPSVAGALLNLLDHADLLAVLLAGADGFISRSEVIGESLAGSVTELRDVAEANKPAESVDIPELLTSLMAVTSALPKLTPGITRMAEDDLLGTLLDSGVASPAVLDQVSLLTKAVESGAASAATDPVEIKGPMSMYRQMKDPDVARGLGYTLSILKALGRELDRNE